MSYLYTHTRLDKNEIFYVGISNRKDKKRAYNTKTRTSIWHNIVNKTEYRVDILFDNLTWEEACIKEKELISLYGRININTGILVNLTDGGEGAIGVVVKESTRKLLSEANKGKHNKLGFVVSEETKEKIRIANRGKFSDERRQRLSILRKGKKRGPHSEETKEKIRQRLIGNKNGLGKTPTEDNKLKLIECNKNRIWTEEMRENMRIKQTGKKQTLETQQKKINTRKLNIINKQN